MQIIDTAGHQIKAWIDGVEFDDKTREQLENLAKMPFVFRHIAAMPDCHVGIGATVGSVIATRGAVIPASVGVDLGCGMMAVQTDVTASDLPDSLGPLRTELERVIPHGRTNNGAAGDRGAWHDIPDHVLNRYVELDRERIHHLNTYHPDALPRDPFVSIRQFGTLGTGNHFVEVCLDESDHVWIMLHSGSRGIGNRIGTYFIEKAKNMAKQWMYDSWLPDKDLAYLPEGTTLFDDYFSAVSWAQEYALGNREVMMTAALNALALVMGREVNCSKDAVNCHHNYVARENHFGINVIVTRKGAVRARVCDLGIIPGSMGAKSFIVRGKGNRESFESCSHGAGRKMSRMEAKRQLSVADLERETFGVECRKDSDVIDESPSAYKSIDAVMAAQSDLVEIVHTLKQVVCVKG